MATATNLAPPITVDQYEHFKGYPGLRDELIFGEIVMSPRPKPLHQQLAENLQSALNRVLEGTAFTAKQNSNIKFPGANSMPAPDVFVVDRKTWTEACQKDEYLSRPPVLVAEVISKANRKHRVEQKTQLYFDMGVLQVWRVFPKKQVVQVCDPLCPNGREAEAEIRLPEPLPGTVPVAAIFELP